MLKLLYGNLCVLLVLMFVGVAHSKEAKSYNVFPGADEKTPSRAQYFSWIDNTNEGATESQTLANLGFFEWLHDEYGMILDIYAFDAGAIDGVRFYGSTDSERFKKQFPNGFDPIYKKAKSIGTRLGLWGGPDGFGNTPQEEKKRIDMMVSLCRDYEFELFKFDGVCGQLRRNREPSFIKMMTECRKYSPDLIALNHRLPLSPKGVAHMTTSLMGGKETYIDVHMTNNTTGTHHRVGAISRRLPPGLARLTEDHGVCLSSCLDYWDDDLILQAFNRCLILAPEVYGSPWLLRDDEHAKFARIFNLHRRYADILVNGMLLPESEYGPHAVSRGDNKTRLLTLRNLTWQTKSYSVKLDSQIGLEQASQVELRQFHPTENVLGKYSYGQTVEVKVLPFRSCLLMASTAGCEEVTIIGCDYEVLRDAKGKPVKLHLLGMPGTTANIKLQNIAKQYSKAFLEGKVVSKLIKGKSIKVDFAGDKLSMPWHRKIADLEKCQIPADSQVLYEATCYAADNNALEVRSIIRSGWSNIPAVKAAQDAFFNQRVFIGRGVWDKYMFDGDMETTFYPSNRRVNKLIEGGALRVDFGELIQPDKIVLHVPDQYSLMPLLKEGEGGRTWAEVSGDLKSWTKIHFISGEENRIYIPGDLPIRYLRLKGFAYQVSEVTACRDGKSMNRSLWRGSNLFGPFEKMGFQKAWKSNVLLTEKVPGSYLCVAINGKHGDEGAYAAIRTSDGKYIGSPDRAVSYPSNTWEIGPSRRDSNYTYYFPITDQMMNQKLEVVLLGRKGCSNSIKPEVWITANPIPFVRQELILQ